jgi:hypothetical protein
VRKRAITIWTQPDIDASRRLVEELDALSRIRHLDDPESLLLERSLLIVDGQRLPTGLNRDLARFGISRRSYRLNHAEALEEDEL